MSLLPVVAVLGLLAAGCSLPAPGPVDKIIPVSDTCNLQVRLGTDAEGSYVAARSSSLCLPSDPNAGTPSQRLGAMRIETTVGTQWCQWSDPDHNSGPGSCSTYDEGVPGQTLVTWYLATAPGSMISAEAIFFYYEPAIWESVPVFP